LPTLFQISIQLTLADQIEKYFMLCFLHFWVFRIFEEVLANVWMLIQVGGLGAVSPATLNAV